MTHDPCGVSTVVPVKRLDLAKSRLDLPPELRRQVALELALGTIAVLVAAPSVSRVVVVTGDPTMTRLARRLGATVQPEPWRSGLNRAVRAGCSAARRLAPRDAVMVVVSDLPDLEVAEVDEVVAEFRRTGRPLLVVDHQGTGTALLLQGPHDNLPARFGAASALRHQQAGYRPAQAEVPGLRHDLDSVTSPSYSSVAVALQLL